jgi:hypothetical protein
MVSRPGVAPVEGGDEVDSAVVVQGAVPGGQAGERRVVGRGEHRRRGAVLYLDQREPCDAIEVVGHGHP